MASIENEMYQPQVDKFLRNLPMLYAFRMAALELGAISLAQGSPSEGPPGHVITNMAIAMLGWVERQPAAVKSSVDPQSLALISQFLSANARLAGRPNLSLELTGYPDIRVYQATQKVVADFLARQFKAGFDRFGNPENHIIIDNYSRHLLNLTLKTLKTLRLTDENATVQENRKHNVVLTYHGHWPLVGDLVKDNEYSFIHLPPSDITALRFEDFRPAIAGLPEDANAIIYINNPNNPLSVMYPHDQQENFLVDVAKFNRNQEEVDLGRRVRVLSDNAYWGWVKPEYIRENGFPFFAKAALAAKDRTPLPVQKWLIECFSLGKIFGMASIGASFAFVGDSQLNAKLLQLQTRDTNMPGADKLALISETLATIDVDHLLRRANAINDNLVSTCDTLNEAKRAANLPIEILGNPEHGAYVSVGLGPEFLNRRVAIQNQPYDVKTMLDICKFLLEKHGIAIAMNDQADLPNTVRIFVDAPKGDLREGVRRMAVGLTELLNAPRSPEPAASIPPRMVPIL